MVKCIATLRNKGTSYRATARILGNVKIRVSLDVLSGFSRETIGQKPERNSCRSSGTAPVSKRAETPLSETARPRAAPDSPGLAKGANVTEPAVQPCGKGPRSADTNNI